MNCPVCNVDLKMTDREGVEIDYCPKCRGVWLDRGELDKIIERSDTGFKPASSQRNEEYSRHSGEHRKYDDKYSNRGEHYSEPHKKHKKRESFLSDLFDF